MLVRENTTRLNPITGVVEQVLPPSFAAPFKAVSPTVDELRSWALDPAVLSTLRDGKEWSARIIELGEPRQVSRLPILVGLRLLDWARAQEGRLFAQATKVGLVRPGDLDALTATTHAVVNGLAAIQTTDKNTLSEDLFKQTAFTFYNIVSTMMSAGAAGGPYVQLALQVVGFVTQLGDVWSKMKFGDARAARARLPLQSLADKESSDAARVTGANGLMANELDWSSFALPPYEGEWSIHEVGQARPADLGFALGRGDADKFYVGRGSGFMPGTARTWDLIQFTSNWRSARDDAEDRRDEHGLQLPPTANWGSHYCNTDDEDPTRGGGPCLQSAEAFTGGRNCRQCIRPDAIRNTSRGNWREYANAYDSQAVNVGDWSINWTQATAALFEGLGVSNPSSWCFDVRGIALAWQETFESLFEAMPGLWNRYDAYAWRAVVSNLAAWALISREDLRIAGVGTLMDWRVSRWGAWDAGIAGKIQEVPGVPPVYSGCPVDLRSACSPGDPDRIQANKSRLTPFLLRNSIWEVAILPSLQRLGQVQLAGYSTKMVAYLWERQGAHWNAATGKLRNNEFGHAYEAGLRDLLEHEHLRRAIHMNHVVDPKIRQLLFDAGVHKGQIGGQIQAPNLEHTNPSTSSTGEGPVLAAFSPNWRPPPPTMPPIGGFPGQPPRQPDAAGTGWLALGALGLAAGGFWGWKRWSEMKGAKR